MRKKVQEESEEEFYKGTDREQEMLEHRQTLNHEEPLYFWIEGMVTQLLENEKLWPCLNNFKTLQQTYIHIFVKCYVVYSMWLRLLLFNMQETGIYLRKDDY